MDELDRWWYNNGCKYKDDVDRLKTRKARDANHPPLQGFIPFNERHLIGFINYTHIPNVFCIAWLILCFVALDWPMWLGLGILIMIFIIYRFQDRLRLGLDSGKKLSAKFSKAMSRLLGYLNSL